MITSTDSNSHNSGIMYHSVVKELKDRGFNYKSIKSYESISQCTGCMHCKTYGDCWKKDKYGLSILNDFDSYTDLIIISPVYFFGVCSSVMKCIERLYCKNLKGVKIHLVLFCGSKGKYSGIKCIKNQFKLIDEYCGTKTKIWNKVTKDTLCTTSEYSKEVFKLIERRKV